MKIGKGTIREIFAGLKTKDGRKQLYAKYREIIMYVVFGALTTIISFASYYAARWIFPDAQSVPVWLRWIFSITSVFGTDSATALPVIISWILSSLTAPWFSEALKNAPPECSVKRLRFMRHGLRRFSWIS